MQTTGHQDGIRRIAFLTAVASVLQIAESYLPHPLPGVRLGMANMITLVALMRIGPGAAIGIAVLRTLVSSFVLGSFLSPGFILSFCAALASSIVMSVFRLLFVPARARDDKPPLFSAIGVSLAGALPHNVVQLTLAYALIVKHTGVFLLLPWLGLGAVVTGWISGLIAMKVCDRLDAASPTQDRPATSEVADMLPGSLPQAAPPTSFLTALPGWMKTAAAIAVAVAAVAVKSPRALGSGIAAVLFLLVAAKASAVRILRLAMRMAPLVLLGCCMPVLFTRHGAVVWTAGRITVTDAGLSAGGVVALRLLLLMMNGALLIMTTPPDQLASGLATLLAPLRKLGIPVNRAAEALSLSLAAMPVAWQKTRSAFSLRHLRKDGLKKTFDGLCNAVANMYSNQPEDRLPSDTERR